MGRGEDGRKGVGKGGKERKEMDGLGRGEEGKKGVKKGGRKGVK